VTEDRRLMAEVREQMTEGEMMKHRAKSMGHSVEIENGG